MKLFINEKQRKNTENLKIPRFNTSSYIIQVFLEWNSLGFDEVTFNFNLGSHHPSL